MAKPIAATPTLEGEDARRFIEEMNKPASKEHKEFLIRCKERYDVIEHNTITEHVKEFLKPFEPVLSDYGYYDDIANGLVELIKKEKERMF